MVRYVLAFCVLSVVAHHAAADEVKWRKDYRAARSEANATQKLLLLDFTTSNCFWCKKLDVTTYRNRSVASLINSHFVALKVNAERSEALARALRVESFPTIVLAAPDGAILHRHVGYRDAAAFQAVLRQTLTAAHVQATDSANEIRPVGYEVPERQPGPKSR